MVSLSQAEALSVMVERGIEATEAKRIIDTVVGVNAAIETFMPALVEMGFDSWEHNGWRITRV